jgi:hypothetical protein
VIHEIAGEPSAVGIARAADGAATVRLAVKSLGAAIELALAISDALDAISGTGITKGRGREVAAVGVAATNGGCRWPARSGVPGTLLGNEPVVVLATRHRA